MDKDSLKLIIKKNTKNEQIDYAKLKPAEKIKLLKYSRDCFEKEEEK